MNKEKNIETLRWKLGELELIDQRLLPHKLKYIKCSTAKDVFDAIKQLKVRGAPAIGIAGAYGVYLGVADAKVKDYDGLCRALHRAGDYIGSSRPTARNLFWAIERMFKVVDNNRNKPIKSIKQALLNEAHKIINEDKKICREMARFGAKLIPWDARILTHCNAGGLATADYGTALGVIYGSEEKIKMVYADETRPVLQGARLTAWELNRRGINTTLICDNMAADSMSKGDIDLIIVGADRIAANGDTANKIGTYSLAINAAYHGIPFYVAAPFSTFDLSIASGKHIPIEERDPDEVRKLGGKYITVKNIPVRNPSFDVTPAGLITAIITEKGLIKRPDREQIERVFIRQEAGFGMRELVDWGV